MSMKERIFQSTIGWKLKASHMEKTVGKSMTVPNEAFTVREIFAKYKAGIGPRIARDPQFDPAADHDSDDLEKLHHLDLAELEQYKIELLAKMKKQKEAIDADKKARDAERAERERELEEVREELRARKKAAKEAFKKDNEDKP